MSKKFCPVCGSEAVLYGHKHEGVVYYFCSWQCRESFLERPDLYVKSDEPTKENMFQKLKKLFGRR